ncbi:MAG TPA: cyclic nucleotide-binding domain-containing protein [Verrucomicrobiales bacterium]|jgi:CRP-like cAMP-binding protein|nr:cyclic nucleotide-binding domain-containing protein [Verrucomicrobiales bacterium]
MTPAPSLPPLGLLAELDDSVRATLALAGRFETLPAETRLATQGEPHHSLVVMLSGSATVDCHAHGDYVHLADIKAGETIGEMNMIDPQKASADVVISERADVWIIEQAQFQSIVERDPHCAYSVIHWLARQLCRRLRQNAEHMLRQAEEHRSHLRDMDY